jgi:hypothetical protein
MQYLLTASKKMVRQDLRSGAFGLCSRTLSRLDFPPTRGRSHEGDTLSGSDVRIEKQATPVVTIAMQRENLKERPGKASGTGFERARNPRASQCR